MTEERFEFRDGLRGEEATAIADLLRSVVLTPDLPLAGSEVGERYFREKYDPERVHDWEEDIVMTVWDGDDLAGFGRARKNGFITHVFVAEEYRKQGLGTRLLRILEESLAAEGLHFIFLDADTRSVGFYERHGWNRREPGNPVGDGTLLISMEKRMD